MLFVVLCPETPEGSIVSGSGFKVSQKMGQWLKVSPDRMCIYFPKLLSVCLLVYLIPHYIYLIQIYMKNIIYHSFTPN